MLGRHVSSLRLLPLLGCCFLLGDFTALVHGDVVVDKIPLPDEPPPNVECVPIVACLVGPPRQAASEEIG